LTKYGGCARSWVAPAAGSTSTANALAVASGKKV
jgi:hypothetical protein